MKKLNALNLGKSLNREEMKSIAGGKYAAYTCTCGTAAPVSGLTGGCGCVKYCAHQAC